MQLWAILKKYITELVATVLFNSTSVLIQYNKKCPIKEILLKFSEKRNFRNIFIFKKYEKFYKDNDMLQNFFIENKFFNYNFFPKIYLAKFCLATPAINI